MSTNRCEMSESCLVEENALWTFFSWDILISLSCSLLTNCHSVKISDHFLFIIRRFNNKMLLHESMYKYPQCVTTLARTMPSCLSRDRNFRDQTPAREICSRKNFFLQNFLLITSRAQSSSRRSSKSTEIWPICRRNIKQTSEIFRDLWSTRLSSPQLRTGPRR